MKPQAGTSDDTKDKVIAEDEYIDTKKKAWTKSLANKTQGKGTQRVAEDGSELELLSNPELNENQRASEVTGNE